MTRAALAAPALAALALALAGGTAHAQSARYPAPAPDPDAEAEARSSFWDRAAAPGLDGYRARVDRSRRLMESRTPEQLAAAVQLLTEATAILPARAEAFWYLGVVQEIQGAWPGCAASYRRVWQLAPTFVPPDAIRGKAPLAEALGTCLARAGELAEAAHHLERLARLDDVSADSLLRLGEVYLAMGRLADAIEVLERASDLATTSAAVHWTLAVAYDRARRPAEAARVLTTALTLDNALVRVSAPSTPYLPPDDISYYLGLAYDAKDEPERAILYFRDFVRRALRSPWLGRAREHLGALEAADLIARAQVQGTASVDRKAVDAGLRTGAGALARCVTAVPDALIYARVVQVGPRSPTRTGELRLTAAEPGVRATVFAAFGTDDAALAAAVSCVEREASHLHLPRPTAPDSWSSVAFPVIAR